MHRQLGDGAIAPDCRHRHLRLERRTVLLPCPLHVLLPRYPRFLGAGLHLSHLSHFRGPAQVSSTNQLAGEYIKSHSGKVKDIMTRGVLSVTEETPVADIAVLLETNRIKRVPVLREGKLVGIVSRANLVRALAMTINEAVDGAE